MGDPSGMQTHRLWDLILEPQGLTTLFHRFRRYAFGWDCQFERVLTAVLAMGIDAVYSDHTDRMMTVVNEFNR